MLNVIFETKVASLRPHQMERSNLAWELHASWWYFQRLGENFRAPGAERRVGRPVIQPETAVVFHPDAKRQLRCAASSETYRKKRRGLTVEVVWVGRFQKAWRFRECITKNMEKTLKHYIKLILWLLDTIQYQVVEVHHRRLNMIQC